MTEGSVTRIKRNGARVFKNPPQPHMCIQDFIQGSTAPCYVNVLSWDKIAMPRRPSLPVPLYGGMRVPPPRTKTEAVVFAVMANPEVLRMSGKNAQDPKKRRSFIEVLLDFIETMNAGIVFTRHYTILKDRDITGELKEVWNAVLAIRDSEQRPPQQETWIDAQPPVPQYPQYPEQQQQEYTPQPPQYHSSIAYSRAMSGEGMHFENYHQPPSPVIPQNDQIYQPGQIPIMPQQYHGNDSRIALDRYNYRERGRGGQIVSNIPQQSCPAYPTAQYQFQQLPRQMMPQYVNSNVHPNSNLAYGNPAANTPPAINPPFQPYISYQQQQQQQPPPPRMDNAMHVDIRRMQQQQQQQPPPQMHLNHVQPSYEQSGLFNVRAAGRPHMGVVQKNNATKRQVNSPTHISCGNCQTKDDQSGAKPKSPVKVLQREIAMERQDTNNHAENNKTPLEKADEPKTGPITDSDENPRETNADSVNTLTKQKDHADNQELARTVDDTPTCEENSAKIEKPTAAPDAKETEAQSTQQSAIQVKPNKFARRNVRTGKTLIAKGDKHSSFTFTSESPKRSQPTMNSIIKSVFKINPGASGEETSGKKKTNGQMKANAKATCENEEAQQGYTILKKEVQEEIVSELAQISIQDCKDATEVVGPVLS